MFSIEVASDGQINLRGRFDAAKVDEARAVFDELTGTKVVNFKELQYISSAGLGVLLRTQKRLNNSGNELILRGLNPHILELFRYAGFINVFTIE